MNSLVIQGIEYRKKVISLNIPGVWLDVLSDLATKIVLVISSTWSRDGEITSSSMLNNTNSPLAVPKTLKASQRDDCLSQRHYDDWIHKSLFDPHWASSDKLTIRLSAFSSPWFQYCFHGVPVFSAGRIFYPQTNKPYHALCFQRSCVLQYLGCWNVSK